MIPEPDTERLTDVQISSLLEMALASESRREFDRLIALPTPGLLAELRTALESNNLGVREAAALLGMNELTLKSWLTSAKPLSESTHEKLAALCLLLKAATGRAGDQRIHALVRAAICAVGRQASPRRTLAADRSLRVLASVLGPTGLMAAALHLALAPGISPSE